MPGGAGRLSLQAPRRAKYPPFWTTAADRFTADDFAHNWSMRAAMARGCDSRYGGAG